VNDILTIRSEADKNITIELYDINGKKILKKFINKGPSELDFSKFVKGMYFAKFNTMGAEFTKIIIKK
jgi:predicted component of type VI protein secretion system